MSVRVIFEQYCASGAGTNINCEKRMTIDELVKSSRKIRAWRDGKSGGY
jgi:hypothetical protein